MILGRNVDNLQYCPGRVLHQVRCPQKDSMSYTAIDGIFILASSLSHRHWGIANSLHRYQFHQRDSSVTGAYHIPELWQGPNTRSNENNAPSELISPPTRIRDPVPSDSAPTRSERYAAILYFIKFIESGQWSWPPFSEQ